MRLIVCIIFFLTVFHASCRAEIVQADTFQEIFNDLSQADSSSLVIFDVDETLTLPQDPEFQRVNFERHEAVISPLMKTMTPRQKHFLINLMMASGPSTLIEDNVVDGITSLQNRSVKVLAMTSSLTVKIPTTKDLKESRLQEMRRLGLDFDASFPELPPFIFFNETPHFGYYPMYYNGVLFTNGYGNTKAGILKAFFREIGWKPRKIFIVDDKEKNLQHLQEEMEKEGIESVCYHYRGVENFKSPEIEDLESLTLKWGQLIKRALSLYTELEQKNGL